MPSRKFLQLEPQLRSDKQTSQHTIASKSLALQQSMISVTQFNNYFIISMERG